MRVRAHRLGRRGYVQRARQLSAGVAVFFAVLLAPATSLAAQRYASPAGTGDCSSANPCSLVAAVNSGGASDDVIVAPGDYDLAGTALVVKPAMTVRGADGQVRPSIHGATDFV